MAFLKPELLKTSTETVLMFVLDRCVNESLLTPICNLQGRAQTFSPAAGTLQCFMQAQLEAGVLPALLSFNMCSHGLSQAMRASV
jgi:hypothetical protein